MELLYLYIWDDKRNIKNCEFNFSPQYRFHYDDEKKFLFIEVNPQNQLPVGWFGKNINNVTAIIGKNGTGKSNLIDKIINSLCGQGGFLFVWKYKGRLYRNKSPYDISSNFPIEDLKFWGSPFNDVTDEQRVKDSAVIYYSPNIDKKISESTSYFHKLYDVSTANLLRRKNEYINQEHSTFFFSDVDYMQTIDLLDLIQLFIHYGQELLIEGIRIPQFLNITFYSYDIKHGQHPTYLELIKTVDRSFEGELKSIFIKQIFSMETIPVSWGNETTFEEALNYYHSNTIERPSIYHELLRLYKEKSIPYKPLQKASKKWDDFTLSIRVTALNTRFLSALSSYYFRQEPSYASFSTIEHHRNISNNFISIRWDGLSSGELSFYTLLTRINSVLTSREGETHNVAKDETRISYRDDYRNFILVLDEPELSFHPEWQQKFLNLLYSSLGELYPNFKFQIIIASHSPILVSDFPKNNIIFLSKDENGMCKIVDSVTRENSFGANIHTLYRNSFFLDGIPIGEFAKSKINKLFDELEKGIIREDTLKEIQLIGEPVLKGELIKLYKQYLDLPENASRRIAHLEKEVRMLKDKLNDKS